MNDKRKKYRLTKTTKIAVNGTQLYQIEAVKDFLNVKKGDLGGYISSEKNLSQDGDAWVSGDAWVFGNAWVDGNARVSGNVRVSGNAWVYGNARVSGDAWVFGDALVYGNARVFGDAWVYGNAMVFGDTWVSGRFNISTNVSVELPRITIDTPAKIKKLKKFLERF